MKKLLATAAFVVFAGGMVALIGAAAAQEQTQPAPKTERSAKPKSLDPPNAGKTKNTKRKQEEERNNKKKGTEHKAG